MSDSWIESCAQRVRGAVVPGIREGMRRSLRTRFPAWNQRYALRFGIGGTAFAVP